MYPVALNRVVFNCTLTSVKSVRGSLDASLSRKGIFSIQSFILLSWSTTRPLTSCSDVGRDNTGKNLASKYRLFCCLLLFTVSYIVSTVCSLYYYLLLSATVSIKDRCSVSSLLLSLYSSSRKTISSYLLCTCIPTYNIKHSRKCEQTKSPYSNPPRTRTATERTCNALHQCFGSRAYTSPHVDPNPYVTYEESPPL